MKVIPAIDLLNGTCVRLTQGDYARKVIYNENPVKMARKFEEAGFTHLHIVDLEGARKGKIQHADIVKKITSSSALKVDFGGGIKNEDDIRMLLNAGVQQVNLGSIAVRDPEIVKHWIQLFGPEKIILSADVKNEKVAINGWSEVSSVSIDTFIEQFVEADIKYITCTDISTDGMLTGPNVVLYKKLIAKFPGIKLIASGGVSSTDDLDQLSKVHAWGVIVGKALYEGKIALKEASAFNRI